MRDLLAGGAFESLDARIAKLRSAYATSVSCEPLLWNAQTMFTAAAPADLDAWVRNRPGSSAALAARGGWWAQESYRRRGWKSSAETSREQWIAQREALERARADLARAIELDPANLLAYGETMDLLRVEGRADDIAALLHEYLKRDPHNFGVRQRALEGLDLLWGGSLEAIRAIADEGARFVDANPRLLLLPGFEKVQRAGIAIRAGREQEGMKLYRDALQHGDHRYWYYGMGVRQKKSGDWRGLLATSTRMLETCNANDYNALIWRMQACIELDRIDPFREDLARAHELWPEDRYITEMWQRNRHLVEPPAAPAAP